MNPLLHPLAVESTLQTEHLVEPPTNRFGCVGGVHPKFLPTGYGSLMGFTWAILVSTLYNAGITEGSPSKFQYIKPEVTRLWFVRKRIQPLQGFAEFAIQRIWVILVSA